MNRDGTQRKAWLAALASGLIIMLVIGGELLRANPTTSANTAATATALSAVQQTQTAVRSHDGDKATQEAIQELTSSPLPTSTFFDKMATLESELTTSPTFEPTLPPSLVFQRPAGVGRLILAQEEFGYNAKGVTQDLWIEKTKDKFIIVYAGGYFNAVTNSLEALIEVEWRSLSGFHPSIDGGGGSFRVPISAQDVRIVDAMGEQLTLRTDDGTLLVFDVPSQQYISVPQSQLAARARHSAEGSDIIEDSRVPFTVPGFSGFNRWSGKNGQGPLRVTVFAGVNGGNPKESWVGQGALAVVTSKGEPTAADQPQVYAPPGTRNVEARGALWIFDVKGDWVALQDHYGDILVFNLTTHQFSSWLDERALRVFGRPLFYEDLPLAQATPAPVTPFIPAIPVSTPMPTAYP